MWQWQLDVSYSQQALAIFRNAYPLFAAL